MRNNYQYLDLSQFRSLYCFLNNPQKMKFYVEGVKCSKCIAKIEGLKNTYQNLKTLEVDLANQTALVELNTPQDSFADVADAIANLGFRPIPIQPQDDVATNWQNESKKDLIRIGVAGFCAGNIMTLAFATYFGMTGSLKLAFEWLQFALYLPVVTYVAWPFYQGFFSGLKQKTLSIDGPMAIASFLGFAVSSWNLFTTSGSIYFDSLSGFLFLILGTRYVQKKTRFEYLKFLKPSALAETFKARLVDGTDWRWIRSDQLKENDIILVDKGEWIPADGNLLNSEAVIDLSVLSGEAMPRRIQNGAPVKAGSLLLSSQAQVIVTKSGTHSLLGHLLASIDSPSLSETQSSRLSDRASQILLVTVLSIATLILISGFFGSFQTQFEKAFALIVLACPCAMAFGTPLAFSFSMRKAQEKGIIVKSARTFEDLAHIDTIFLDKTGTLTDRYWNISNSSLLEPSLLYKQLILLLESKSEHPIAFALREIWFDVQFSESFSMKDFKVLPSQGVQASINGIKYEFKHFIRDSQKWFGLYQEGHLIWHFQLLPILKKGTLEGLRQLKNSGYQLHLLSGDTLEETQKTAHELGISPVFSFAGLSPQMKQELVQRSPNSLMIGDGVNDSLALQKAKVGVAVKGGVDLALKAADVLFLNGNTELLPDLFNIASQARRQIRRNLTAALIYNLLGGTAAILGWVNPFVAALLMPISSIYILATTWWGTRA